MGCGDSKDRSTVARKNAAQPPLPQQAQVSAHEEPDDETEVMARAKRKQTIEEPVPAQPVFADATEKPDPRPEATQRTEASDTRRAKGIRFKSGGGSAMEDLEQLEASLNATVPTPRLRENRDTLQTKKEDSVVADTRVDDLLEDLFGDDKPKKL